MDKYIDTRFDRVEKALTSLIDSIAKYTPSTSQANELAASDRELAAGLMELQTHQANNERIQQLRQETADLDAQIRSTIAVLWATRKEITTTAPTTKADSAAAAAAPRYDFTYAELLDYARRISRTTLPPPGVTNGVDLNEPSTQTGANSTQQNGEGSAAAETSRAQTPAGTGTSAAPTPVATAGGSLADSQQPQASQATNSTALPDHMLPAVNLLEGAVFYPWPGEDRIRGGALALNTQLSEAGISARGYDPEEEARRRRAEEEERREMEERQRVQREEHERRMREERERMARERAARAAAEGGQQASDAWRRGSGGADPAKPAGAPGEKKQFQFMGGLDDDDDDD
jgi:hypothetical protein